MKSLRIEVRFVTALTACSKSLSVIFKSAGEIKLKVKELPPTPKDGQFTNGVGDFTMAWREDADLFFRLLEAGHSVVHEAGARVVHPVRPAPWAISTRKPPARPKSFQNWMTSLASPNW